MPHSYNRIWIHAIWSTKERLPLINSNVEKVLYPFIVEQFKELGCPVRIINGMFDHVHCLFLLNPMKTTAEIIKQIKGSSSHFINQQSNLIDKFAWQTGYAAFSVSESVVDRVYEYIANQKQHHQKRSVQAESDELINLHNAQNNI
ncbi:MAG: IS200/IS605 family transposase [Bacteroidales bacterium]|nr:IS200/IS605 family transposase [Bacteroidales bacterium]